MSKEKVKTEQVSEQKAAASEKKSNPRILIAAAIVAVLVVGGVIVSQMCCNSGKQATPTVAVAPAPKQAKVEDNAVIVALIGSEKVTIKDLEKIKNAVPQIKDMNWDAGIYNKLLDVYVNNRVILNAAKKANLENDPAVKKALEDNQNQILFQAYLGQKLKERMTKEALIAVYDKMMEGYIPEEEVHARHILVETEKEAKDLIVKLKNGAKFEDLANKHSKDTNPAGNNGGDLGYFKKRMMIPEFGNAAFAIKKGQFSEKPVKTPFGWHVIKVEDRRQAQKPTINEVLEEVQAKFTEETVPVIVAEELKKANVVKLDPLNLNPKVQPAAQPTQAAQQK